MRIGIDCDGVLRDFIGSFQDTIKKYHPELADQLKTPTRWDWEQWIPFWTDEETEKFVFEDHTEEIFFRHLMLMELHQKVCVLKLLRKI